MRSSSLKRCFFAARSSTIDSITRSQSARSPRSDRATRPSAASRSARSSLPRSTCLASDFSRPATIASAVLLRTAPQHHLDPGLAATSAMPLPMIPEPTIPTRLRHIPSPLPVDGGEVTRRVGSANGQATRPWSAATRWLKPSRRSVWPARIAGGGREVTGRSRDRRRRVGRPAGTSTGAARAAPGADEVVVLPTAAAFEHPDRVGERATSWFACLGPVTGIAVVQPARRRGRRDREGGA